MQEIYSPIFGMFMVSVVTNTKSISLPGMTGVVIYVVLRGTRVGVDNIGRHQYRYHQLAGRDRKVTCPHMPPVEHLGQLNKNYVD
jgi:hypothetical protein